MTKAQLIEGLSKTRLGFLLATILEKWYFMNFAKAIEARIIFKYLAMADNHKGKACDIGCGCGEWSSKLAKKGYTVYGIDPDTKGLKAARTLSSAKDGNPLFILGNAEELPFKVEYFDLVISVCAIEHFKNDSWAIQEMNRVLKTHGILILTTDSFTYGKISESLQQKHRIRHQVVNYYSVAGLVERLRENGFKVEKSNFFINSPISAYFFVAQNRYPLLSFLLFPVAYPLSLLADKLLGKKEGGYLLAVTATKLGALKRKDEHISDFTS